jgi:hypothetical protein
MGTEDNKLRVFLGAEAGGLSVLSEKRTRGMVDTPCERLRLRLSSRFRLTICFMFRLNIFRLTWFRLIYHGTL